MFVSVPFSDFNRGTILEMIEKVKTSGKWYIGRKTLYRKQLSKGDKILFYQAGEEGKKFVGSGELLSNLQVDDTNIFDFVTVGNIELWRKHVPINDLIDDLSFIKDRKHWGLYIQGGIVRITKDDFELVLRKARSKYNQSRKKTHK